MKKVKFDLVEECDPANWTDEERAVYLLKIIKSTPNNENLHFGIHFGYEQWRKGRGLPFDACGMNEVFPVAPFLPYCIAYVKHIRQVMAEHYRAHGKDDMTVSLLASPHIVPDGDRATCHLVDGSVCQYGHSDAFVAASLGWLMAGL